MQANDIGVFMMEQELDYWKLMNGGYLVEEMEVADGPVMEDAAAGERVSEHGAGWKVGSEVDELVVRLAHMAGELEARKEIAAPEWDDLCGAIRDAIQEYYENPSETNPFVVEDVAEKVFRERFARVPDIEAIEKYFALVNLDTYGLSGRDFTQEDYRVVLEEMKSDGLGVGEAVRQYLLRVRRVLDEELDYPVATGDALLSMIPVMQHDGVTLAQVSEELNYRERAGVVDGSAGWDDSFYDYSTEELQFIESAWSKMEAEKGAAKMEEAVLDDLIHGAENLKVEQPFDGKGQDLGER